MNLRLRLIVAFFVLSVVPLGAVTFYTYASNAAALREAAGHEAESLAGDLTQRMQLVTTQISERVEHLMDAHRETDGGTATAPEPTPGVQTLKPKAHPKLPSAPPEPVATTAVAPAQDSVAQALGEVAMILNNIEVRGWRPPPGGRGTPPPGVPTDGRGAPGGPGSQAGPGSNDRGFRGEGDRRSNAPGGPRLQPVASGTAIRTDARARGCASSGSTRTSITRGPAQGLGSPASGSASSDDGRRRHQCSAGSVGNATTGSTGRPSNRSER